MSLYSLNGGTNRSRSVPPYNNRNYGSIGVRARSPSPYRRPLKTSHSVDFEHQGRSQTPQQRSNLRSTTTRLYNDNDYHNTDDGKSSFYFYFYILLLSANYLEFHSTKDCAICRLHHMHIERSRRAKALEQVVN